MNTTRQIDTLNALADLSNARAQPGKRLRLASVRVSPGGYLAAASILTYVAVLLLRSGSDLWALLTITVAWLLVPALAFTDRISFDGDSLNRRGLVPFISQLISGKTRKLNVTDFERVETTAVRTLRRGGSVRYRYRSQILGKRIGFVFASGGKAYRRMVRQLFPLLPDDKLDLRSRELRDYLCEPRLLRKDAALLHLASLDVLDAAAQDGKRGTVRGKRAAGLPAPSAPDLERARLLRRLANRLRVAGRLRESGEAFRRALLVLPNDGWLIHDFARLLRSQASAQGDARLLSRARAALRLSSIRAGADAVLLLLVGESLIECADPDRAQQTFQHSLDLAPGNVRAYFGLADVALRDGKLAHVIHHYRDAARVASDKALGLYARREADYYARLNDDDDYLAAELRRIGWLQNVTRVRGLAARVTNASILVALIGPYVDPAVASIGWSVASSSLIAWISTLFAGRFLAERHKPVLLE